MGRKYQFHDQQTLYFVTFTVVRWIDVFTRDDYRKIFVESVQYCQRNKGLQVYAWCIMSNHVHMIIDRTGEPTLSDIVRDLKAFTSRHIRKELEANSLESRKEWLLWMLGREGRANANNKDFQLWQQHNHPIELSDREMLMQRLQYLHNNPVKAGFVIEPQHWRWSSAMDYCGNKGMIDVITIE